VKNVKKILNFFSFVNEARSYPQSVNLPGWIIKHIEKETGDRALKQFVSDRNFGGMYLEDDPNDPDYKILFIDWENSTIQVPVYRFDVIRGNIDLNSKEVPILNNLLQTLSPGHRKLEYDPRYTIYVADFIITALIHKSRKESNFLNPFEDVNLQDNEAFKMLEKIGCKIVSTDLQKKKGTLVFSNPKWHYNIGIYPNGYIRSLGAKPGLISKKQEILSPIYDEPGLNIKLTFLFFYTLKKVLMDVGIPLKEVNSLIKLYSSGSIEYDEMVKELVETRPQLLLYLPPPIGGFDDNLKASVELLNGWGVFD
jgi:hypothetical protein